LSSVESEPTENPIVETVFANYKLITNQEDIDYFCDSNGFAISRINIDYRDPFFKYVLQTSSISLQQLDVNLHQFGQENQLLTNKILTKNIPFGLIIVPVAGSKYNPFNTFSRITSVTSSVTRSLSLNPSLGILNNSLINTTLDAKYINESGQGGRVGLVEPIEERATTFRFRPNLNESYTNTFYSNGSYNSTAEPVSSYGASYLVKDVIDFIIQTYPDELSLTASSITWYDVYRRVPADRLGEIFYDCSPEFLTALRDGFRGIKIRHVLNLGPNAIYRTLPDDERCIIT
jgi:hypothetical protein